MIIVAFVLTVSMSVPLNDEFFIISSVDLPRNRLVLKRPTEVTVLGTLTASTEILGEHGEHIRPADLRSGDTVYAVVKTQRDGQLLLMKVRRGAMTVEQLRLRYLLR